MLPGVCALHALEMHTNFVNTTVHIEHFGPEGLFHEACLGRAAAEPNVDLLGVMHTFCALCARLCSLRVLALFPIPPVWAPIVGKRVQSIEDV